MAELADLLRDVADGVPPATDGDLTVLSPPDERSVGVLAFAGCNVVSADVSEPWVRGRLSDGDLSAPLQPLFLTMLSATVRRRLDNLDAVLVARATGRPRGVELMRLAESSHPRVHRALARRTDVRVWSCPGGLLVLGRGVAGRWEVAVEVEPALRGFGLGRGLFAEALGILPAGEPVWAQVAAGNAASLRAVLAAGYRPVGAEVLLTQQLADPNIGPFGWFETGRAESTVDVVTEPIEIPAVGPGGLPAQEGIGGPGDPVEDHEGDHPTVNGPDEG